MTISTVSKKAGLSISSTFQTKTRSSYLLFLFICWGTDLVNGGYFENCT